MATKIYRARFTEAGALKTGLTPTITIWEDDGTVHVNAQSMSAHAAAPGWYSYTDSSYDPTKAYTYEADGGATLSNFERYKGGTNAVALDLDTLQTDATAIKAKTDNLPSDPADQSLLVAEHDATQATLADVLADTNEIQGKLPSGDICNEPAGTRAIVLHTQEADTTTIPQAAVSIWADAGHTNLVCRKTTDVSGNATVNLDDGTYYWTAAKSLYTWAGGLFVVSADGTENLTGVAVAPATPSSPTLCTVYGTVLDASGNPISGEIITAQEIVPAASGGYQLSDSRVSATTDALGYFELELVRGTTVKLGSATLGISGEYTVPEAASQDISTWAADS